MAKIKVPLKLLADALTILPLRRLAPFPGKKSAQATPTLAKAHCAELRIDPDVFERNDFLAHLPAGIRMVLLPTHKPKELRFAGRETVDDAMHEAIGNVILLEVANGQGTGQSAG